MVTMLNLLKGVRIVIAMIASVESRDSHAVLTK